MHSLADFSGLKDSNLSSEKAKRQGLASSQGSGPEPSDGAQLLYLQ